jgi:AraC-like DNA-binding protein
MGMLSLDISAEVELITGRAGHGGVPVAALARAAGLAPSQFHKRFLAEIGETPARHQRRLRIQAAKARLRTGEAVTSLALDLGFSSSQHFATAFRAQTGLSPTQWLAGQADLVMA